MSDRWIPVLAATVGVLGGIGGALIGGLIANQGQAERFQAERQAAIQDVRRETYADFLQTAEDLVQKSASLNEAGQLETVEEQLAFIEAEGIPVLTARAAVDLVADEEVRDAANEITDALQRGIEEEADWELLKQNFVEVARMEVFPDE